jgi:hypothetical protein
MRKITILSFVALMASFVLNCKTMQFGHIKKIGDKTYALEVAVSNVFFYEGAYLALCTADAAGNLTCVEGANGGNSYGAVVSK